MKINVNENSILAVSTGLLAGLGTTLNFVSIPSILASSDPHPVWCVTYNRGKLIALSNVFITTLTGIRMYYKKEDVAYLLVAGFAGALIPWTVVAMLPTNKALFALENGDNGNNDNEVRSLVKKWEKLQYVRTILGWGAFLTTVVILTNKK